MMKKYAVFLLCAILVIAAPPVARGADMDTRGFNGSLSDWILGTSYGITSGSADREAGTLTFVLPKQALDALTRQDREDIRSAMLDMLSLYLNSREAAQRFTILYRAESEQVEAITSDGLASGDAKAAGDGAEMSAARANTAKENLVFIHHSVGGNWLKQGLSRALGERGYHVADITYGWREYGDHTDTRDWPLWFTDGVMALVYRELGTMNAENSLAPADAQNTIVLFKSCFPNSDTGDSIDDEMTVYSSLLPYFAGRPDKMFILVTPPPMIRISNPGLTRQLCRWLTDRQEGWLAGQDTGNVFVFDLYNILTHPDAHHRIENGQEVHREAVGANSLYYDSHGDDHPNQEGNEKATEEFIPLLDHWHSLFTAHSGNIAQKFIP